MAMQVTSVTEDDGKRCFHLIQFLKRVQGLSGEEVEEFMRVRKWVHDLAMGMAGQLKQTQSGVGTPPPPADGFRVKSMGQLPVAKKPAKRGKKK